MVPTPMAAPPTGLCQWCRAAKKRIETTAPEGPWLFCPHCDRPCEEHRYCQSKLV